MISRGVFRLRRPDSASPAMTGSASGKSRTAAPRASSGRCSSYPRRRRGRSPGRDRRGQVRGAATLGRDARGAARQPAASSTMSPRADGAGMPPRACCQDTRAERRHVSRHGGLRLGLRSARSLPRGAFEAGLRRRAPRRRPATGPPGSHPDGTRTGGQRRANVWISSSPSTTSNPAHTSLTHRWLSLRGLRGAGLQDLPRGWSDFVRHAPAPGRGMARALSVADASTDAAARRAKRPGGSR